MDNPVWCLPTIAVLFQIVWLFSYILHRISVKKYAESEQQKKSESKVRKILFVLSFVPVFLIVVFSTYYSIIGYSTGLFGQRTTIYGFQAFAEAFAWTCIMFTIIPVLPLMLVWQIFYIVRKIKEKNQF